jgi:hypothetical protein
VEPGAYHFPNTARDWVVQRKDVDGFYGAHFEAGFAAILYKEGGTPVSVLFDKTLSRQLEITITAGGESVPHFYTKGEIPEEFTGFEVRADDGKSILLGLKQDLESILQKIDQPWEMWVAKDVRLPALVSLIKSGYLTLFSLLGYRYALSTGGLLVGRDVLGRFFRRNGDKPKRAVSNDARTFFRPYVHMVRPIVKAPAWLSGTVTDRTLFLCRTATGEGWAVVVFVKTSAQLHAVLLPMTEGEGGHEPFLAFLRDDNPAVSGGFIRFERDHWDASPDVVTFNWPKPSGLLG